MMSGDPEDPDCFDGIEGNAGAEETQKGLLGTNPYRGTIRRTLSSLCYVHNELINIWTHVLATIVFVCLFTWHFTTPTLQMDTGDRLFCAWFFLGTTMMLGFSAAFHIVFAHSEAVHACMLACDLSGIVLAICGGTDVTLWLLFRCQPRARIAYLVVFNLLCAALLPIALSPRLRHNQGLIVPSFTGVVVGSLVPLIHAIALRGGWPEEGSDVRGLLTGVFAMLSTYGVGVVLYAFKLPEAIWPGKYDFWGQSHQLWHTLIFPAPLFEYLGVLDGLRMKAKDPSSCSAYML